MILSCSGPAPSVRLAPATSKQRKCTGQKTFPECAMLLSLPLYHCLHFSLGLECLSPISSLLQCLLISQEPVEFLPLSEAFPDPLGVVPLLHGSSLSSSWVFP